MKLITQNCYTPNDYFIKYIMLNLWCKRMEGEGGWGKVCFLSTTKKTLMVNITPKQINLTPKQMVPICIVAPTPLIVHTIPKLL